MHVPTDERLTFLDGAELQPAIQRPATMTPSDKWTINDSSFIEYCRPRLGCTNELADRITPRLLNLIGGAGVDLAGGANGNALRDLMGVGLLSNGLLTTLKDRRTDETKAIANLDHVAGDLLKKDTWGKIIEWARAKAPDEGLSLVIHRPVGPLQHLTPEAYSGATHFLLDMLRPGGVLLCQVPLGLLIPENKDHLKELQTGVLARPDVSSILVDTGVFFPRPAAIMKNR